MFEAVKKLKKIIFMVKNPRMIDLFLIILLSMNDQNQRIEEEWSRSCEGRNETSLYWTTGVRNVDTSFHATLGQFKYVVSVRQSDTHLCTGTIIDETHILTIAHVLIGKYKDQLSVAAGVIMVMHPFGPTFSVEGIYLHPKLGRIDTSAESVGDYWENNIAIIKLTRKFQWSTSFGPVQFMKKEVNWSLCPECVMISWKNPLQEYKDLLNQVWDFIYGTADEQCYERSINVLKNQKCFSNLQYNLLITSKDLGSPIICGDSMVGFIVKKAENEEEGTPSTFLKTLPYLDFIHEVLTVDVRPGEFPYIVSIWHDNSYICGGSILDAIHILTAAHCVWDFERAQLKVVAGHTEVSRQNIAIEGLSVHDIIFHEQYKLQFLNNKNYWYTEHDIAILVLTEPVMFALTWSPLDYENVEDFAPDLLCNSFYWRHGKNEIGMKTIKLRKTRVKILSNTICEGILKSQEIALTVFQFCARNPYRIKTADYRDCGNPVISDGKPVGILARAFPLDDQSPAVAIFLWLHPYKEFIRSVISRS